MKQTQHVTPDFAKSLVLIASMAAINPSTLMPLYDASKMGVVGICRALYGWYAQLGIKVVTVLPVFVGKAAEDPERARMLLTRYRNAHDHRLAPDV
jgi:short-subunit dehydrogenase